MQSTEIAAPIALRPLKWGKLNVLHTTDTHGWYSGHSQEPQYSADWGDFLSFTHRLRELADRQGVDLLFVDTGDRIDGSGLSDATEPKGKYVREVFSTVDMDVVTIGNHELYKAESTTNEYLVMRPRYGENWVVSNVDIHDPETGNLVPLGNRFRKFTTKHQKIRVTAFGFLFDFTGNDKNTVVYPHHTILQESWFQSAIKDTDVGLFLIIGHTPVRDSPEYPAILQAIRAHHPETPVQFIGGHTHIRDFVIYDDFATGLESGRYCETVGFVGISHIPSSENLNPPEFNRRYIDFNRHSFQNHSSTSSSTFDTPDGLSLSKKITAYRSELGLDEVYGCAPQDYYLYRVPYPNKNSLYSLLSDRILLEMVKPADKSRENVPTLIFINTGSQRFDIFKGPFTKDTGYCVNPFTPTFRSIKDVKYSSAKKLIALFNGDGEPWMEAHTLHSEEKGWRPPLVPLEPHYHFSKLEKMKQNKFLHTDKATSQQALNRPSSDTNSDSLTPGYTTIDDAGTDGDDTPHSRISYFRLPNALVAERNIDKHHEPKKVDVVFMDFIQQYILSGLLVVGERHRPEEVVAYMYPEGRTLTELMLEWVKVNWGGEC